MTHDDYMLALRVCRGVPPRVALECDCCGSTATRTGVAQGKLGSVVLRLCDRHHAAHEKREAFTAQLTDRRYAAIRRH